LKQIEEIMRLSREEEDDDSSIDPCNPPGAPGGSTWIEGLELGETRGTIPPGMQTESQDTLHFEKDKIVVKKGNGDEE
jgi:hypothetical protein